MENFDELLNYLDSDDNEYGLSAIATHGFLTALVVGKPLDNWQSVLFEDNEKQVPENILAELNNWYHGLLSMMHLEQKIELPFELDDVDFNQIEETLLEEWAIGFVYAMYANDNEEDDWFADESVEEDVAMLTLPMMLFSGIDQDEGSQQLAKDPEIMRQLAESIEDNLTELFLLFHTHDE